MGQRGLAIARLICLRDPGEKRVEEKRPEKGSAALLSKIRSRRSDFGQHLTFLPGSSDSDDLKATPVVLISDAALSDCRSSGHVGVLDSIWRAGGPRICAQTHPLTIPGVRGERVPVDTCLGQQCLRVPNQKLGTDVDPIPRQLLRRADDCFGVLFFLTLPDELAWSQVPK